MATILAGPGTGLQPVTADEAREIAVETYIYAYPLVISELTRRECLLDAPMNQFQHRREFPDASFKTVVRPNADTLYSVLWFDVSKEPLVIMVPDSQGRYYLLPMLDMWSDVFDAPGSRTTGTRAQTIVIAGAAWQGQIPSGAILIRSPTAIGWVIGRTQTNGRGDYESVHRFQAGLTATPLSRLGMPYMPKAQIDPSWDLRTPPVELIEKMSAQRYLGLFAELMKLNPPHGNDYPMEHRMARIGIIPGMSFSLIAAPGEIRQAVESAAHAALESIKAHMGKVGAKENGWRTSRSGIGSYGTDYLTRAAIAYAGLGANCVEDAIYPTAFADGEGKSFSSDKRYVIHFNRDDIPPARAFWSLTMYDQDQFFAANPINRYAIGDRDKLKYNRDGSLDLYIQRASPGSDKESNWLPAPASGRFTMNLRLYWPKAEALDGTWSPPPVRPA